MSFSTITRDPSWGTGTSNPVTSGGSRPDVRAMGAGSLLFADLQAVMNNAAVDTSGVSKPLAGWITYTGGGGGPVNTRPTTGMLYPRGTC